MYAIVEIQGQQFKVQPGQYVYVHRIDAEEGTALSFPQVFLLENEGTVTVGQPTVAGVAVQAKVLEHLQGDKVIVFKKKRRKGYRLKKGHRQQFTKIQIDAIA